jgi:UDPglucose 6-dehydrogenase
MKITVIGSGYVGLVTGACLAELGNHVCCFDVNKEKIDLLNSGEVPIYEPGLKELISQCREGDRLYFTSNAKDAIIFGDILFIAVGTPSDESGSADLSHVLAVAKTIGRNMDRFKVVVNKSTVPVGSAEKVKAVIEQELQIRNLPTENFSVVSNPEFLKEGAAIDDFMKPDRIIVGTANDISGLSAKRLMKNLYSPFNRNHERTLYIDIKSAELTKYAANAMLATRISFMNEMANLADLLGADIDFVRQGIGSDKRIGYDFLYAGTGYGGSCFPKDVSALINMGSEASLDLKIIKSVNEVNNLQKNILIKKIIDKYGNDLSGLHFAVWGLSFKPNTDDVREAPSLIVIKNLLLRGAKVKAFDPVAIDQASLALQKELASTPQFLKNLSFCASLENAAIATDALLVMTEWRSFKSPSFSDLAVKMKHKVIFDGRNLYDPEILAQLGFEYYGIGRNNLNYLDSDSVLLDGVSSLNAEHTGQPKAPPDYLLN